MGAIVRRIIAWAVILIAAVCVGAAVVVPRLAGADTYTILTGSMTPELPVGSLAITRPVDPTDLEVGDVITYQLESGVDTTVTHRITAVDTSESGERVFQTRGDANDIADAALVRPVQIRGELWYSLPWLGYLGTILPGAQKSQVIVIIALALFAYAGWSWISAAIDRSRRTTTPKTTPATES